MKVNEVFNSEGRAKPPLVVITQSGYESDEDSGPASSRRRKLMVAALLAAGAALLSINFWGGEHPGYLSRLELRSIRTSFPLFGIRREASRTGPAAAPRSASPD
jgi:hypothetical protein